MSAPSFAEWLAQEMPAGTVIGNPAWWANRIARRLYQHLDQYLAESGATFSVRGQIAQLLNGAAALAQQPAAAGEEIMVNAAHDVYTLPLQPSGLSSGPRFVVHVPGPEQQPAAVDKARFKRAPCYLCGYNGPGYYQPDTHPCAAKYHAAEQPDVTGLVGVPDYINDAIDNLAHDNYEPSYDGYLERKRDAELIRAHIARTVTELQAELARELQRRFDGNEQASREHREEVKALVEALEVMVEMVEMNGFGRDYAMDVARKALDAYRKEKEMNHD